MSFKKIFVAVDSSAQASVVFEQAVELATKDLANLMVFHGVE
ncbi:MAG: universal stress protein, partial [Chroococcidiopsis sp.]